MPEAAPAAEGAPEAKPDETPKPTEPAAPTPEPLSYAEHKLALPEGVSFDDKRLGEYDAVLGKHQFPPEARQELANLYADDTRQLLEKVRRDQYTAWTETRAGWREDCAADRDFGGNRFETSRSAAIRMIEFVVPPGEREEFNAFLTATGAADHPQFFRFLNRLAQRFDEPAQPPSNIRPVAPQGRDVPRNLRSFYGQNRANRG